MKKFLQRFTCVLLTLALMAPVFVMGQATKSNDFKRSEQEQLTHKKGIKMTPKMMELKRDIKPAQNIPSARNLTKPSPTQKNAYRTPLAVTESGATLYGNLIYQATWEDLSNAGYYSIDPNSGAYEAVGTNELLAGAGTVVDGIAYVSYADSFWGMIFGLYTVVYDVENATIIDTIEHNYEDLTQYAVNMAYDYLNDKIYALTYTEDGYDLMLSEFDRDTYTYTKVTNFSLASTVTAMAFDANGSFYIINEDGIIRELNPNTGEVIREVCNSGFLPYYLQSACWSFKDNKILWAASNDYESYIISVDVTTGATETLCTFDNYEEWTSLYTTDPMEDENTPADPPTANEIIIGAEGTTSSANIPMYEYYCYSISQQIYTAAEMQGITDSISSIAFKQYDTNVRTRNLAIYLVNTDKSEFVSNSDWLSVPAENLVFSGEVTYPGVAGEWLEFELQTPFEYTGNNLMVCVLDNTGNWAAAANFYTYDTGTTTKRALYTYRDGDIFNPTNPSVNGNFSIDPTTGNGRNNVVKFGLTSETTTPDPEPEQPITSFSDDFNDGELSGWRVIDADDDGHNWMISNSGIDNSNCIMSVSYSGGFLDPDNYIVTTSQYTLSESSELSFYVKPSHANYIYDNIGVVISEDNENWTVVWSETFEEDTEMAFTERIVNLSEYAGKNIYVGFRHYDCNAYGNCEGIFVDNFVLTGGGSTEPIEPTVPAAPANLVATANGQTTISLTWDAVENATSYNVYNEENVVVAGLTETTYTVENLTAGTEYCYNVTAVNEAGESEASAEACATTESAGEEPEGNELVIGNGTDAANVVPFRASNKHSFTESIYASSEFSGAMTISSIAYHHDQYEKNYVLTDVRIYMGETEIEEHTTGWVPEEDLTLVYTGANVTIGEEEWETFVLDTPFAYSGNKNLVIAVAKSANATDYVQYYYTEFATNVSMYAGGDDVSYAQYPTTSGYTNKYRPNIKITYTEGAEIDPEPEVAEGDTWQDAIEVTEYPFSHTPDFANLNNDYTLPGEEQDGKDVVYKLTLAEETTIAATVNGANGKVALYTEDFNGQDAPGADNYYGAEGETAFFFDFNDGSLEGWETLDADGDFKNWKASNGVGVAGIDNTGCIYSESFDMNSNSALTPNNFIFTKGLYTITENSTLSFDAIPLDPYYHSEYYGVVVSADGENFITVWEHECTWDEASNWIHQTIDLSEYAGRNMYVGLRHFNCSNELAIVIDNLELSNGTRSTKSNKIENMIVPAGTYYLVASATEEFSVNIDIVEENEFFSPVKYITATEVDETSVEVTWSMYDYYSKENKTVDTPAFSSYNLYKKNIFTNEIELLLEKTNDTAYVDYAWATDEPGSYQWGASAIYTANKNRGRKMVELLNEGFETGYNVIPEGWTNYSEPATANTYGNFNVTENLYNLYYPCTGTYSAFHMGGYADNGSLFYLVSPAIDMTATVNPTISFNYVCPVWAGAYNNMYVKYSESPTGPWTTLWEGTSNDSWVEATADLSECSGKTVYIAFCALENGAWGAGIDDVVVTSKVTDGPIPETSEILWSNPIDKDMTTSVTVYAMTDNGDPVDGTVVSFVNLTEEGINYEATLDETGFVTIEDFRKGTYELNISKDGYYSSVENEVVEIWEATDFEVFLTEILAAVEDLYVSPTGWAMWKGKNDRALESYTVILDGYIEAEGLTVPYYQHENLINGAEYTTTIIANYTMGESEEMSYTWVKASEDNYAPVTNLVAESTDDGNILSWALPSTASVKFDFEVGMGGWTTIDANGDDHIWYHNTECESSHSVSSITSHTGAGHICSESYCNGLGVLYPDDYIVSPQQLNVTNGSRFTFWVCAQDMNYQAEHFGVAVSTTGNTSASDFTTIAEWTIGAKGTTTEKSTVRGGGSKEQTAWIQYSVDLSEYAGQDVWVAIRHFNCSDQFILLVDDIEITTDKGGGNNDNKDMDAITEVLGIMIYKNGELLNSTPITGNSYTDINGQVGDEYCVKVVYGGELDYTYYAMSEAECVVAAPSEITQSTALASGWNWYSSYIDVEGAEGLELMKQALGTSATQIKSQTAFIDNTPIWFGTLTETKLEEMYMIKMNEALIMETTGPQANPADNPITLRTNWNWIGYPINSEMSVNDAFSNITPNNGDYVKSQFGFAQYLEGLGWTGTLNIMNPGQGYMYQNTSGTAKTLVYPEANAKSELDANITSENNHWVPNSTKYPTNMTMIATVEGMKDYEVAAFCNGEVRGSARPIYVEQLDSYMLFLTIYGEENDEISFRYFDLNTEEEVELLDVMNYGVNVTIGDVMNPHVLNFATLNVDEMSSNLNIYPNPVEKGGKVYFGATCEKVEIYNTLGAKVAEYTDVNSIEGIETSGVYVVKAISNGNVSYSRIIVE